MIDKTYAVPPGWDNPAISAKWADKPTDNWVEVKGYELTTKAVVELIIKPACEATKSSYADQLTETELWKVGKPAFTFVSHAWGNRFKDLVTAALDRSTEAREETFVWIDIFASALPLHSLRFKPFVSISCLCIMAECVYGHSKPVGCRGRRPR